eukprot:7554219-Pyramimonas_sp.AAC.1
MPRSASQSKMLQHATTPTSSTLPDSAAQLPSKLLWGSTVSQSLCRGPIRLRWKPHLRNHEGHAPLHPGFVPRLSIRQIRNPL